MDVDLIGKLANERDLWRAAYERERAENQRLAELLRRQPDGGPPISMSEREQLLLRERDTYAEAYAVACKERDQFKLDAGAVQRAMHQIETGILHKLDGFSDSALRGDLAALGAKLDALLSQIRVVPEKKSWWRFF